MLSTTIENALNRQVAKEAYASYLYLSMASWCDTSSLPGSAKFLYAQSEQEWQHMLKLFNYMNKAGNHALTPTVSKVPHKFKSMKDIFKKVYLHEKEMTLAINEIVQLCLVEQDFSSFHFLQWYVSEQHEEEHVLKSILDKIELIGTSAQGLFLTDKEIGEMAGSH